MLGYILVVDTPWSSISNATGSTVIGNIPPGEYELVVWTPRAKVDDLPAPQPVKVESDSNASVTVQFAGRLSPPHELGAGSLSWENY
jgi:hypothetical protein